ncbi:MAG TPA: hypothetical protein VMB05_07865 [Solirubrobacteraceae bacterium]|nr:hypothetical protein [Solirubrobacteraceae bacterium]
MKDPHSAVPRPNDEAELVELVRSVGVPAPESLHRKVDAMIAAHSLRPRLSGDGASARSFSLAPRLLAIGAIAAAVIALALAFSLSGSSSTLSVRDAAALTHSPATHGPPPERSGGRELAAAVDGVWFPYWGGRLGWHASGSRLDHVDGRTVKTVFYEDGHGKRIGYAIVAGSAPSQGAGGVVSRRDGTPYRVLTIDGAPVVTWHRAGHLCVVSGHGVSGATLLHLASWEDHGASVT